jgi:protein-L-isoaspartate(D-aspartate) O-methyltransferase
MSDFASERASMVQRQLANRGVRDQRVLKAMGRVPREAFIPASLAYEAYADGALPIDCGQTISQPIIVAMMTEALQLSGDEKVLEIGTGCGYQTAILVELAAAVFTIERHAELAQQAEIRLRKFGYQNIFVRTGDGSLGWSEESPFDRIIVTAAAEEVPPALWQQLREGGILVGPFGPTYDQALYVMHKISGKPQSRILTGCRFVPLVTETPPGSEN